MPIPDYQTFMLPTLKILAAHDTLRRLDIVERAGAALALTDTEKGQMLASGRGTVLLSRVVWALTYMKQAGLVQTTARGVYQITDRGRTVLAGNPVSINTDLLNEFEDFRAFVARGRGTGDSTSIETLSKAPSSTESPEEALEAASSTLRADLISQLIDILKKATPARFETIVIDVLQALGYGRGRVGAARAVGRSGDGGIDGVIDEDRLGLDSVYVQAKRWEGTVGRPVVQAFAGALQGQRAHKGVMITTSDFSADARAYVENLAARIVLINGQRLAELMIDHNVGVSVEATYTIKRLDSDYFEE
jgi:restriction system protein